MASYQILLHQKGEIRLPPEVAARYGLNSGARVQLSETSEGILIHPPPQGLRKIYLEPTNLCNLNCSTCVRQDWRDPQGMMEMEAYEGLIQQLAELPKVETLHFGGYGEPLLHPEIEQMLRMAKEAGRRTELITNALLLDHSMAEKLVNARLDTLIFSVDGLSPETYEAIRIGASFEQVRKNVEDLAKMKREKGRLRPRIGLEFVAMKQNIRDLERLASFSYLLGASFVIINNLLPHMEEMKAQTLYNNWTVMSSPAASGKRGMHVHTFDDPAEIRLPKIQLTEESYRPLFKLLRLRSHEAPLFHSNGPQGTYCRFVNEGYLAVAWDGEVSPCLALMHSYGCYILDRYKEIRRYGLGNVRNRGLQEIWEEEGYAAFRSRVKAFEFSPCAECGGCHLSESNEEDCFGNPFPVCGDCLWARGILQCP